MPYKDKIKQNKYRLGWYHRNRAFVLERRSRIKREVLAHYGNGKLTCVNCGCETIECLSIDHIRGEGGQQRKQIGKHGGGDFYAWLKNQAYPEGYQTLCMNCQWMKRRGEVGKHKNCGGIVIASLTKLYRYEREDGKMETQPAYICTKCKQEIINNEQLDNGQ